MKNRLGAIIGAGLLWFRLCDAGELSPREVLTQLSTIDALLNGVYDGDMTIAELKTHGDFGLGTFNSLDGEMVMADGRCWQVLSDGTARPVEDTVKTPFAAVTFFDADRTLPLKAGVDFKALERILDSAIPTENIFYAIRVQGLFKSVRTRSVPRQQKPYPPLGEIVKTQPVFDFQQVKGMIVGFRCPPYAKSVAVPGYHLHFISEDRKTGGHVLDFSVQEATAALDDTSGFSLILPNDKAFYETPLGADRGAEIKAVEK